MPVMRFRDAPTLRRFLMSEASVCILQGPVESGKSVASLAKVYKKAITMPRCVDGIRRSRFLIWRQTYPQLKGSVMETVKHWFPEKIYGKVTGSEPYYLNLKFLDVECQLVFQALPEPNEKVIADLRSTEWTGAWGNEAQFSQRKLVVEINSRTGRYPSKDICPNYDRKVWHILDLNAPSVYDHWILHMRGDTPIPPDMPEDEKQALKKPDGWEFFVQPPAIKEITTPEGKLLGYRINPHAENLSNMGEGRYLELVDGRTRSEVMRDLGNKVVPLQKGIPRYPKFDRSWHVSREPIVPDPEHSIIIGGDFGLKPAFVFMQQIARRWIVLDELVFVNMGADEAAPLVKAKLLERFPFYRERGLSAWGDPQGSWGSAASAKKENTPYAIFQSHGIPFMAPAQKDQPSLRYEIGRRVMSETVERLPKLIVDPRCVKLIASLDGGATMKEVRTGGGTQIRKEIVKDDHSHVCEAFEYPLWGGGEGKDLISPPSSRAPKKVNAFGRKSVYLSRRRKSA